MSSKKKLLIFGAAVLLIVLLWAAVYLLDSKREPYQSALAEMANGDYTAAAEQFGQVGDYKDAVDLLQTCRQHISYNSAATVYENGDYEKAAEMFAALGSFQDAAARLKTCNQQIAYAQATALYNSQEYEAAAEAFAELDDFRDAIALLEACNQHLAYAQAVALYDKKAYEDAAVIFAELGDFLDADTRLQAYLDQQAAYEAAAASYQNEAYEEAAQQFAALGDFHNSADRRKASEEAAEEARNAPLYDSAKAAFAREDYEAAAEGFAALPDTYQDVALYATTSQALRSYQAGDWLDAAQGLDALRRLVEKNYDPEDYNWLLYEYCSQRAIGYERFYQYADALIPQDGQASTLITEERSSAPLLEKLADAQKSMAFNRESVAQRAVDSNVALSVSNLLNTYFSGLYWDSLYHYYAEQTALGLDITKLEELPLAPNWSGMYWDDYIRLLYSARVEKLQAAIEAQGLAGYYDQTDSSPSPVAVTGNGIYIHYTGREEHRPDYLNYRFPPHCLASTPEEVRYVLILQETYAYYGTYTDGSTAYATTANITLKDTQGGDILFQTEATSKPPEQYTKHSPERSPDFYPSIGYANSDTGLSTALAELYPLY